jgi:7-carboxy-7-deazaguanine synthase
MPLSEILAEVLRLAQNEAGEGRVKILRNLVVITGGEPLRQPIERLCEELLARGFLVQIETNGTLYRELPQGVRIICSPKISQGKYYKVRADLLARIDAFKFIISASKAEYLSFAEVGQSEFNVPVYLQPMDEYDEEKNRANVARVLELAAQHGFRISLQMHKILKIA